MEETLMYPKWRRTIVEELVMIESDELMQLIQQPL